MPEEYIFRNNKPMNKIWGLLARMSTMSTLESYSRYEMLNFLNRVNDVLSLRREVMHGQFESLIPLLMYHDNMTTQEAMTRAGEMVHECHRTFDEVEEEMYKQLPAELRSTMKRYLKACKDVVVCNLHWSYGLRRYMDEGMLQPDGRVVFPIRLPPKSPGLCP